MKISVCVEPLFPELPYEQRMEKVAAIGYDTVEFWLHDQSFDGENVIPKKKNLEAVVKTAKRLGLEINNIDVNSPDGHLGGSLVQSQDRGAFLERFSEVISVAHLLDCEMVVGSSGNTIPQKSREEHEKSIIDTLSAAGELAAKEGITFALEPLNTLVDHPGQFLSSTRQAAKLIRTIDNPHIRLLYDIYHMQIMEGNILSTIAENIDIICHIHAAGVPGYHELSECELDYAFIFQRIKAFGYKGKFGIEYWPSRDTDLSLRETLGLLNP